MCFILLLICILISLSLRYPYFTNSWQYILYVCFTHSQPTKVLIANFSSIHLPLCICLYPLLISLPQCKSIYLFYLKILITVTRGRGYGVKKWTYHQKLLAPLFLDVILGLKKLSNFFFENFHFWWFAPQKTQFWPPRAKNQHFEMIKHCLLINV